MSCRSFLHLGQSRFKLFQHRATRKVQAGSLGLITRSQATDDEGDLLRALLNLRPHHVLNKTGQTPPVAQDFFCGAAQIRFNMQRRDVAVFMKPPDAMPLRFILAPFNDSGKSPEEVSGWLQDATRARQWAA